MTETSAQPPRPFLYVVVCAAQVASDVGKLITAARERDWEVGVIATPLAMGFFDPEAVETQTGRPIRSAWRRPGDPRPFPAPDAVLVAPATFNTLNKWAAGIADTLGRVRKVPSSARRAGLAASGACSRRAGRKPSYWIRVDSLLRLAATRTT